MLYLEQGDKMNKLELIDVISKQLSLTKKDCRNVIDTFLDNIIKELQEGKKIVLSNFGVFETRKVATYSRFHPQTGEKMMIKYPVRVYFRPSSQLKKQLNGEQK